MSKQVSISMLKKEVSAYDEFVEVPLKLADGSDYSIKLFPYFKPELIRDLIKEMAEFYNACQDEGLDITVDEQDDLICFYIIKHFTNLKYTSSKKAKRIYEDFKVLINTEIFKELLGMFPIESIEKVKDHIHDLAEASTKIDAIYKQELEKFNTRNVVNKDILLKGKQ